MNLIPTVYLPSILALPLLVACVLLIQRGRVEIVAGIYFVNMYWNYSIMIVGISLTWVLLPTLVAAAFVYWDRRWGWKKGKPSLIEDQDTKFVVWLALWILWIIILFRAFPTSNTMIIARGLFLYTIIPVAAITIFGDDPQRVRGFALAFIGTSVWLGFQALAALPGDIIHYLRPASLRFVFFGGYNYHWVATLFVISIIFLIALFQQADRARVRLGLLLALLLCAFFLTLTRSLQTISGALLSVLLLTFWTFRRRTIPRVLSLAIVAGMLSVGLYVYRSAPWLFGLDAFQVGFLERRSLWQRGLNRFLSSPVWGSGLDYFGGGYSAHSLTLDVLAGEGITGFVYFIGFIFLVLRYARGTWPGVTSKNLATWRMAALALFVYTLWHTQISGGVVGDFHFFWGGVLIWRLGVAARHERQLSSVGEESNRSINGVQPIRTSLE